MLVEISPLGCLHSVECNFGAVGPAREIPRKKSYPTADIFSRCSINANEEYSPRKWGALLTISWNFVQSRIRFERRVGVQCADVVPKGKTYYFHRTTPRPLCLSEL